MEGSSEEEGEPGGASASSATGGDSVLAAEASASAATRPEEREAGTGASTPSLLRLVIAETPAQSQDALAMHKGRLIGFDAEKSKHGSERAF